MVRDGIITTSIRCSAHALNLVVRDAFKLKQLHDDEDPNQHCIESLLDPSDDMDEEDEDDKDCHEVSASDEESESDLDDTDVDEKSSHEVSSCIRF